MMSESVKEPVGPAGGVGAAPAPPDDGARDRVGYAGPDRPAVGWTEIGIAAAGYLVLTVLAVVVVFLTTATFDPYGFPVLIASGVATIAAVGVALSVRIRRLVAVGVRSTTVRWIAIAVGAGLLLRVLAFGVALGYQAITGDVSNPQQSLVDAAAGSAWQLIGVLVGAALLAPLAEELLLRGVLYGGLRRYGVPIALVVSSVVFGLMHGINVVLPIAILLGAANALLYERSRSIWVPVASHVVFNASGFALIAIVM